MEQSSSKRKLNQDESDESLDNFFEVLNKKSKEDIDFNFNAPEAIFVYISPSVEVDPSFVCSLLGSYDRKVKINNHFAPCRSSSANLRYWYGAFAMFSSEEFAKAAAEAIEKKYRFLKVLSFEEIINILKEAEYLYPKPTEEATMIVIKGHSVIKREYFPWFNSLNQLFGKPNSVQVYRNLKSHCVISRVYYTSQLHAYATKIVLDGSFFKKVGCLSVEVNVTDNEKRFDRFVRNRLKNIIHNF